MSDEQPPEGTDQSGRVPTPDRRQFLKYLTAGALGAGGGVALDRSVGGDGPGVDRSGRPVGDERSYDAFVRERDGSYEGLDPSGGTIDSGSDGWSVLQNSIEAVPEGGSIYVNGRYESSSTLDVRKSINVYGDEAIIDQPRTGNFTLRFLGEERYRTALTEAATTGDNTLTLDDMSGVAEDDILLLKAERADPVLGRGHQPSEAHSVLSVGDDTARLADTIVWRDDYGPGTLVYVLDPIEVHVSGLDLRAPAKDDNYYGIAAQICRNSSLEGLRLEKFGSRAILLGPAANARVRDCTVVQSADIAASDGYGIQVWSGCHDVLVEGCTAKECRHALSVTAGGNRRVASRAITFRDCFASSTGAGALNCHGGSAHDVRFEGCTVHTSGDPGLTSGAQQTNVSGCEFRLDGHNAVDTRGDGQEMVLTVTDTDIYGATNAVKLSQEEDWNYGPLWDTVQVDGVRAYGCNHFFTLSHGRLDGARDLAIKGCYWDEVGEEGIRLWNRLDSATIDSNDFGQTADYPYIFVRGDADNRVRNVRITGNRFGPSSGAAEFIRLVNAEGCLVADNTFESRSSANMYVGTENSTGNTVTRNTYYAPNPPSDPIVASDGTVVSANRIFDTIPG